MNDEFELREEKLRVFRMFLRPDREHLDAFLNYMVPVLVVHAFEHVTFEL